MFCEQIGEGRRGFCDIADDEFGVRGQRTFKPWEVRHREIARLEMLGQIAIVDGRRHTFATVETHDTKPDTGRARRPRGDPAHVQEARTARDTQLDQRHTIVAIAFRRIGGIKNGKRILLAHHEVERDLHAIAAHAATRADKAFRWNGR